MLPALLSVAPSAYRFETPCLLCGGELRVFKEPTRWQSGAIWQQSLETFGTLPQGIVLPLELESAGHNRQDLLGYELLVALRWSGNPLLRGCPVFLAAWQPLEAILRKKPDLLLVRPAVEFHRLPEAIDRLPAFIRNVTEGQVQPASPSAIDELSGADEQASRVSYHDLANDFYAAYRLWKGYLSLLRKAESNGVSGASAELLSLSETHFEWESYVESKLRTPLVRRFQASRAGQRAPRYPVIEQSLDVLAYHLQEGLPPGTRILMVDDEFHKGSAEALLKILFRAPAFTKCLPNEWVYSELTSKGPQDRWARFVCVRSAELARNWLAYWDGIGSHDTIESEAWEDWLKRWDRELSPGAKGRGGRNDPLDVFAQSREFVLDRHSAGPRITSTVVLLDLRLEPVQNALYSIKEFSSYHLRRMIKAEKPDLPIVMFTASRQVLNFAELLDASSEIDGWFIKEGPDIPVEENDENSANSVAYLLERVHLYSTLRGWYRASFAWDSERKLAYSRLFHSKEAGVIFDEIATVSSRLFQQIRERRLDSVTLGDSITFLKFIQERVPSAPFAVSQVLVARRVALAVLLWTADVTAAGLSWNADDFASLLPGRPIHKRIKWVYDKLNFNQVLWMRSSDVLSQLLREELDWLENIQWPAEKRSTILAALLRERQLLDA